MQICPGEVIWVFLNGTWTTLFLTSHSPALYARVSFWLYAALPFLPNMDSAKLYNIAPTELEGPMRQRVVTAFQDRQLLCTKESPSVTAIVPHDWQVSAATEFLSRRDVIVITATGSGKSLSYLLALIANPGKIVLAIFPLLSLMTDQVSRMTVHSIPLQM